MRIASAPGAVFHMFFESAHHHVYQMDADPGELFLVAIFESRQAYWDNAQSPEQDRRYLELRALLDSDPEWHDGEIISATV